MLPKCDKLQRTSAQKSEKKRSERQSVLTAPNPVPLEGETLCLKLVPDTAEGKVKYHNQLMQACGLSLQELVAAMEAAERNETDKRSKRPRDD